MKTIHRDKVEQAAESAMSQKGSSPSLVTIQSGTGYRGSLSQQQISL
jgi:hypothetical protein